MMMSEIENYLSQPHIASLRLDTPEGSDGMCVPISYDFLEFVKARKPDAEVAIVEAMGHPNDRWFWHCLAKVNGRFYDFTLRQIDKSAPVPLVTDDLNHWREWKEHGFPYDEEQFDLDER